MPSGIGMSTAFRSVSESDGAPEELAAASGLKVMSAFVRLFGGGCDGESGCGLFHSFHKQVEGGLCRHGT